MVKNIASFYRRPQNAALYIHGFGGSCEDNGSASSLARHYDYYAINLPGHGKEDLPCFDSSIEAYADYVAEYIIQKKLKDVLLIGHSLGGGVVSITENKLRAAGCDALSGLVLINPVARSILDAPALKKILFPHTLEEMFDLCRYAYFNFDKMNAAEGFSAACELSLEIQLRKEPYLLGLFDEMCGEKALNLIEKSQDNIQTKTLYMTGKHDKIVPPAAPAARLLRHKYIKFFEFEESGHCPHNEEPERFIEAVLCSFEN